MTERNQQDRRIKKPEGIYSSMLPKEESDYTVSEYIEDGYNEKPSVIDGITAVTGREIDSEGKTRREYLVNKNGEIFEIAEFNAHPYSDENKEISRTVYKNGAGEIVGVRALIKYKEHGSEQFWEWEQRKGGQWDPTILENEPPRQIEE
jgi:hypothetical protein